MSRQELDIEFSALRFNENAPAAEMTATLPDESQWFYREGANPEAIAKEKLYWEWVNRFFPKLILERRTVYKEKVPVGSCWKKCFVGEKKLLECSVGRLVDFNAPQAFAVLFFLNQSYSFVNSYSIDLVDSYKIDRFKFLNEDDEKIICRKNMLIRRVDNSNEELLNFVGREDIYSASNEQNKDFVSEYLLGLLYIVLMPNTGWDAIFSEKQVQLRRHLLESNVIEVVGKLSSKELLVQIDLFCRQFTDFNSKDFFDYRNAMIKNYCLFLVDLFSEKVKTAAEQFVLSLERSGGDHALNNMDERAFHLEMIRSILGKIYLNTQAKLSSEYSLDYFVRCLSLSTILINCLSICSVHSHEMVMLAGAFHRTSEMASNAGQLNPIESRDGESLKIDLNKFSQLQFAKQCVDWLKRTETIGLSDVLLNKNLLVYMYQRALAQFKGAQPTSYPRFLSAAQPVLPDAMEQLYQRIVVENNPEKLCVFIFDLMKIAPSDFWNLFLRQLAVVVFSEDVMVTVAGNVMLPENRCSMKFIRTDIERLLATAKVPPESMSQLNANFKEAMLAQIKESHDSQTSGFRTSGSGHTFLPSPAAAAVSQPAASTANQQTVAQSPAWLVYVRKLVPLPF